MARDREEDRHQRRLRAFGKAVREARHSLDLSQEAFGYKAGLDRTYVSGIERGVRNPTARVIWQIADALDRPPSVLLARAEELEG